MGINCYSDNGRNSSIQKMVKLKNNFEKKELIGLGGSSKVKCNI